MHSLGAVLARSATVFVDALCLALSAAHTGAAGPEGGGTHNRRHRGRSAVVERRLQAGLTADTRVNDGISSWGFVVVKKGEQQESNKEQERKKSRLQ